MSKGKVLIIEDTPALKMLAKRYLERGDFEVIEASNGLEGLKSLQLFDDIKLIFLDLMMPQMNGLDFLKKVKDYKKENNIKICIMTAKDLGTDIKECLKMGADDYLIKPVDEGIFVNKAKTLLKDPDIIEFALISVNFKSHIQLPTGSIEITIIKLSENLFVFKSNIQIPLEAKVFIASPELEKIMGSTTPFLARIISSARDGRDFKNTATFVGLKDHQYNNIRSITNKGRDI